MSERRQNEWKIFEEKALHLLSDPNLLLEDNKANLVLRLWQYPAFERHKVWAIYHEPHEESLRLIKAVWNRQNDFKRFSEPLVGLKFGLPTSPGFSTKATSLKAEIVEPCFAELLEINIPPFVA